MGIDFAIEFFSFVTYPADEDYNEDFANTNGYIGDSPCFQGTFIKENKITFWQREVTVELGRSGDLRQPILDLGICEPEIIKGESYLPACGRTEIDVEKAFAYIKDVRRDTEEASDYEFWVYKHVEAMLEELTGKKGYRIVIAWG